jgi:hypothetical protein
MILLLSKNKNTKIFFFSFNTRQESFKKKNFVQGYLLPRKSCTVLMSCMILSSKVFQKFNELRHFSRKQNFWPEEAKNALCTFKIAPRLYMAATRFSQAA